MILCFIHAHVALVCAFPCNVCASAVATVDSLLLLVTNCMHRGSRVLEIRAAVFVYYPMDNNEL